MTRKTTELTPQQWRRVYDLRAEWLTAGTSTAPADRPAAQDAITRMYQHIGEPPPGSTKPGRPAHLRDGGCRAPSRRTKLRSTHQTRLMIAGNPQAVHKTHNMWQPGVKHALHVGVPLRRVPVALPQTPDQDQNRAGPHHLFRRGVVLIPTSVLFHLYQYARTRKRA